MRTPRAHQREALAYANPRKAVALIMEMRLGKTLVATRWAAAKKRSIDAYASRGPGRSVLIVTPPTTFHVWRNELRQEGFRRGDVVELVGSSKAKAATLAGSRAEWVIVNPEGLRACPELCTARDWLVVLLDETGGWMTNPKSQITKLVTRKLAAIPYRAILTGRADPNGPEDFVEQMRFISGREFMGCRDFWTWRKRYMRPAYFGWDLKPSTRRRIKRAVRKLAFIKTAKQAGCFVPKVFQTRFVEASPRIRKLYKELRKDWGIGQAETKYAVVTQNWLSMLAGGIVPKEFDPGREIEDRFKVRELVSLIKGELSGKQVVIWARFTREIKLIQRELKAAKVSCFRMTGLTKQKFRGPMLEKFRKGVYQCGIIQSKVGQYALPLHFTAAQIFYSNVWSGGTRGQQEKRSDHMDKKEPVLIVDLVTRGTVDEALVETLNSKQRSSKYFVQKVLVAARKKGVI